ncbi:unnamed protein product [Allacma fusca]|uniref:glutathione transferase n=1 Tax=Allacma fusca TaxID=39272 RepID=A0A8J2M6R8_9HEXA|nr:unnamed protein product [Allacma fusca]
MPQYKLTYFNLTALGEPIRWAFKIAGVDFEDERIEISDWAAVKKSGRFPQEQIPLLEIDGEVFTQSTAILKYLGKKFDLDVDDAILRFRLDQIFGILDDARIEFRSWFMENDPDKKQNLQQTLVNESIPRYLRQVEEIVAKTDGNFITGSKLTYGDLYVANILGMWLSLSLLQEQKLQDEFPKLATLRNAVVTIPAIKSWIAVRPKTLF